MSNRAITWAYAQQAGSVGAKAVLVALADQVDGDHQWCIKQADLAAMTEQSERAVRGHLAELVRRGLVIREKQYAAGRRKADRYRLPVQVVVGVHRGDTRPVPARSAGSQPAKPAAKNRAKTGTVPAAVAGDLPAESAALKTPPTTNSPTAVVASSAREARGTRLPDDWLRSEQDRAWQAEQGIPDEFAREHTAAFKDYWRAVPGAKGRKLDWSATWRNWMRREWRERAGEAYRRAHGAPPRVVDFDAERERAKLERQRARFASTDSLASAR